MSEQTCAPPSESSARAIEQAAVYAAARNPALAAALGLNTVVKRQAPPVPAAAPRSCAGCGEPARPRDHLCAACRRDYPDTPDCHPELHAALKPRPGAYLTEKACRRAIDRLPADSQRACVDCAALITDWDAAPVKCGDGRWYIACGSCARIES